MKLQENFKAFCDGELSIAERQQVAQHLESNEADRKAVEDLQRLSAAIREYVTRPEAAGLEQTLAALELARPRAKQRAAFAQQMRWLGWTAAAVVGVGFIATVMFPTFAQSKAQAKRSSALAMQRIAAIAAGEAGGDASTSSAHAPAGGAMGGAGRPGGAATGSLNGARADMAPRSAAKSIAGPENGELQPNGARNGKIATPPPQAHSWTQSLIQKDASLTVRVKNVADAQQNIEGVVAGHGGWVQQSNRDEGEGQAGVATLTLRVPVSQFDVVLKSIRALGDVVSDSSSGNDVTGDVVDMDARLKVLRAEESDYMVLLGRARRTGEIMEIRDKLTQIRTDIESIVGQRNVTKDMAAFSTISVTLEQRPLVGQPAKLDGQDPWLGDTWATAVNGLSVAGKLLAQLFIFVLVWAPIWVPTALLGAWAYRKLKW
ncbi:MAG: DUF4349 domain-containing protein [Fimbriimonadaceae bacterium]